MGARNSSFLRTTTVLHPLAVRVITVRPKDYRLAGLRPVGRLAVGIKAQIRFASVISNAIQTWHHLAMLPSQAAIEAEGSIHTLFVDIRQRDTALIGTDVENSAFAHSELPMLAASTRVDIKVNREHSPHAEHHALTAAVAEV